MIFPRRIYDLGLSHKAVSVYCYLANRADENGEPVTQQDKFVFTLRVNFS